jgi:hypothetical protein
MANVDKLIELIYGSSPTDDEVREIVQRLKDRLGDPKPDSKVNEQTPVPVSAQSTKQQKTSKE